MRTIRQMLRQPVKMIAGLLLMTLAVAILCVCVGQSLAAKTTGDSLNDRFTTIAIPAGLQTGEQVGENGHVFMPTVTLPEELRTWLEDAAASHPDVVKGIMKQGILSAYIPELTPLNYTQGKYISTAFTDGNFSFYGFEPTPYGAPYSCAMLVITLDEVSEPTEKTQNIMAEVENVLEPHDFTSLEAYWEYQQSLIEATVTTGYTVKLSGTVTQVVSLQEGFRDPTGMTARLTLTVPALEQLQELSLTPGERYLVYGMDYYDEDWALRGQWADERNPAPIVLDAFDLSKLHMLTEEEKAQYENWLLSEIPVARYDGRSLFQREYEQINAVSMTLALPVPETQYEAVRDEAGKLLEVKPAAQICYTDIHGTEVAVDVEEYIGRYQIPTIVHLTGAAEDFIRSSEGALWQAALERDAVNNSAFAVIGVDKLGYMADFARQNSQIVEGREFTAEEIKTGAKVCVLHEALAASANLKIGDTITANFYRRDPGLPYEDRMIGVRKWNPLNPSASFYFDTTPFSETAGYTVVGIYRSKNMWCDVAENAYGFSPNTVFVPKSSVETEMEYLHSVPFTTIVIHNGKLDAFWELAAKAGFSDRFFYHDQGYSTIANNFHNYAGLARKGLLIGLSVYTVIALLFLLLYPRSQTRAVRTMESLGAPRGKRFAHVMLSSMGILLPASILGGAQGMLLWQSVVEMLQESAGAAVALQGEDGTLAVIAIAQFLFVMLLNGLISLAITAPKGLAARREK